MEQLEGYRQRARKEWVSPMAFAYLYSFLGERDQAFEWLATAEQQGSPWLYCLAGDPTFEPLRSDPRYGEPVRKRRLPVSVG